MKPEVQEAIAALHPGDCIGWFDASVAVCRECYIRDKCKEDTEKKDSEPASQVEPLDYLLKTLAGPGETKVMDKGSLMVYTFGIHDEGKFKVLWVVAASKTAGSVLIRGRGGEQKFDRLESIAQVEEALARLG